jgi:hypothetical protein
MHLGGAGPGAQALPLWLNARGRLERMQIPPRTTPRETTEVMVRNISRKVRELKAALAGCRGDLVAEPKVMAALLTHLLVSRRELLQNQPIDTARRPLQIKDSALDVNDSTD